MRQPQQRLLPDVRDTEFKRPAATHRYLDRMGGFSHEDSYFGNVGIPDGLKTIE
jgi:hypothetical protein